MDQAIRLKPPYIPLLQKPTCCAVTCLQMILFRNGYGLHDQEDLAVAFGVKIDPENAKAFRDTMPVMTRKNFDEGIQTVESEKLINGFLRVKAPGLAAKAFKYSSVLPVEDFLRHHLNVQHDVWIEYHGRKIHADDRYKGDYIHDGLVESFDTAKNEVVVIDPLPEHRQRLYLPLPVVEEAISTAFGRETGFVVVSKSAS